MPKLVLHSSATIDEHLNRKVPKWFNPIMKTAASHVYEDLMVEECPLRAPQQDLVSTIFLKPLCLTTDKQGVHKLSLDEQELFVSYIDLTAATIEAADDLEGRYEMQSVGVGQH
jgi:hypothetical protein